MYGKNRRYSCGPAMLTGSSNIINYIQGYHETFELCLALNVIPNQVKALEEGFWLTKRFRMQRATRGSRWWCRRTKERKSREQQAIKEGKRASCSSSCHSPDPSASLQPQIPNYNFRPRSDIFLPLLPLASCPPPPISTSHSTTNMDTKQAARLTILADNTLQTIFERNRARDLGLAHETQDRTIDKNLTSLRDGIKTLETQLNAAEEAGAKYVHLRAGHPLNKKPQE